MKDSNLNIISIEKIGPRPKISNIQITLDGIQEVEDKTVLEGTPLQINFKHSIDGGETTVDKTLPYITNGIEKEVTFKVTGVIDGKTYIKLITISIENKYREKGIAEMVQIGDFVNYSAGEWTQADLLKFGDLYSGVEMPTVTNNFGGFEQGMSKNNSVIQGGIYNTGWRVLSINDDGTVNIISAGTPMAFYKGKDDGQNNANTLKKQIYYSMFEDCSTDAVNTSFAVQGSAHAMKLDEFSNMKDATLKKINIFYCLAHHSGSGYLAGVNQSGEYQNINMGRFGVRPVITLKADTKVKANDGDITHRTAETAWNLTL